MPLPLLYGSVGVLTRARSGTRLMAEFDAHDASTVILSGANVTGWNDRSGNGRHATTPVGHTVYPAYDAGTGELIWNAFAGVMGLNAPIPGAPKMSFIVVGTRAAQTFTSASSNRPIICSPVTPSRGIPIRTVREGASPAQAFVANAFGQPVVSASWPNGTREAWCVLVDAIADSIRIVSAGGTDQTLATAGLIAANLAAGTQMHIGYEPSVPARCYTGRVERLRVYHGLLSAAAMSDALAWGIS